MDTLSTEDLETAYPTYWNWYTYSAISIYPYGVAFYLGMTTNAYLTSGSPGAYAVCSYQET